MKKKKKKKKKRKKDKKKLQRFGKKRSRVPFSEFPGSNANSYLDKSHARSDVIKREMIRFDRSNRSITRF